MENGLWTEKYRPKTLSEIVGQDAIVESLMRFVEERRVPHCLFSGPPGTSKTTAAMAMARDLFQSSFEQNFMELNASDERGIDVVRNQVKMFARSMPAGGAPFKILVLDEADHLTADAQHALRRTMESYASSCRMILICNYSSRIIPPLQSRCTIFRFSRLSDDVIGQRLRYIAKKEGVPIKNDGLDAILYLAEGDMRAAINLLQGASATGRPIDDNIVFSISGRASPETIRNMLWSALRGETEQATNTMRHLLLEVGVAPLDLVRQIHKELRNVVDTVSIDTLQSIADTEFRITEGSNGEIQLTALLSALRQSAGNRA